MPAEGPAPVEPHRRSFMQSIVVHRRWALALLVLACGCRSPEADMKVAEQFTQVSDALVDIRDQMVVMSGTVDSLVAVVAKQDTVIKRLAAANGVPVP
jgi:hypothetical protein